MKEKNAKTYVNVFFAVAWIPVVALVQIYTGILESKPVDENIGIGLMYLVILQYYVAMLICYLILWRSVYHLFDVPRRVCYTVVDVLSIIALIFGGGAMTADTFSVHNWDIPYLGIAIAVLVVRIVCFAAYRIAELFKKPSLLPTSRKPN